MMEPQEEIKSAQDVQNIVKTAEPSKEEAAALQERLKQEMLTTIEEMRAATERMGPYGAQVGTGDQAAFILREPLTEKRPISAKGPDRTHHVYVVATTEGFKGLEILSEKGIPPVLSAEEHLIYAISKTQPDGKIRSESRDDQIGYLPYGRDHELAIPAGGTDFISMYGIGSIPFVQVTPEQVTSALETSIAKAQAPHKTQAIAAKTNLGIAADVRTQLQSK